MLAGAWLELRGIAFKCVIGVTARERLVRQEVIVDLCLKPDFGRAARSDSIDETVDYRAIVAETVAAGEKSSFQLIETLAAHLARRLLDRFPPLRLVRVDVEKPGALKTARSVRAIVVLPRRDARHMPPRSLEL